MKITSLDKENVKILRIKLTAALNRELTALGLSASIGNIRFNAASLRTKLEVRLNNAPVSVLAKAQNGLASYAARNPHFGNLADKVIIVNGEQYVLKDYTASRPKFPFTVERVRRPKMFKMPEAMVRNSLSFKQN